MIAADVFDIHVHPAPDVVPRLHTDAEVVELYVSHGAAGIVLKAHHESTVNRARAAGNGAAIVVRGGITLNESVGGINPAAVATALAQGGAVVWFPTEDSAHHIESGAARTAAYPPGAATAVLNEDGRLTDDTKEVIRLVAEHDAVLATGHLDVTEGMAVLDEAHQVGVERLLVTHPTYVSPGASAEYCGSAARRGAHIEITTYQAIRQADFDALAEAVMSEVPASRLIISSDSGQAGLPDGPTRLDQVLERLTKRGASETQVIASMSSIPQALFS